MKHVTILIAAALFVVGCSTPREAIKQEAGSKITEVQSSTHAVASVLRTLSQMSTKAERLSAGGTITLKEGSSSQSGSFALKSKRLSNGAVIDSMSLIVSGPFGITAVKFLGSPTEYRFYNALEGESYTGKPSPKELEKLTGMKGLSIEALNNVLYGLAPSNFEISANDSVKLTSFKADEHLLYISRGGARITETFLLRGKLSDPQISVPNIVLLRYQRWNRILAHGVTSKFTPDLSVSYEGKYSSTYFRLPNYIRASNGSTALEVEYTNAVQNPNPLTVKIKMPE